MSTIPETVREEVHKYVTGLADAHNYLDKNRPENAAFIRQLLNDPAVGGRLREYMPSEGVKTYIKDGILNKYSKKQRPLPRHVDDVLCALYTVVPLEIHYSKRANTSLHVREDGGLVVVTRTTTRWETGLRRILLYVASNPRRMQTGIPDLVLVLFQYGNPVNGGDRQLIERALKLVDVKCCWG